MATEAPQSGSFSADTGTSVYANELNFEPQDLDPDLASLYEATLLEGADSHIQTLMDAPEGSLLGSIDKPDNAATPGYPNVVTSTSHSASQPTANSCHDATPYTSPSTGSVGEAVLRKTHIGALSNSGTTPQASNVLVCKVPEVGCTCFCCKHKIMVDRDRDDYIFKICFRDREFLSGSDMLDGAKWRYLLCWLLVNACSAPDCDRPHGVRRQTETQHLFSPQLCNDQVRYRCAVQGCHYFSVRRFELKRHHAAKHCTQPERFPCPEPYCKYGGDNGFIRPDKLKEHHKKIHEGKHKPGQALRTIKSAATKPVTELV